LREVLRIHRRLRRCLKRCRHCGIYFLTHPCNAARQDLRCPFGCRGRGRKRSSNQRSVEYYRTDEGKTKKKELNAKRSRGMSKKKKQKQDQAQRDAERLARIKARGEEKILEHVRMVVSQIEGRPVSREEIEAMLAEKMRQHSLNAAQGIGYIAPEDGESPP
jgi:hypothetical protein